MLQKKIYGQASIQLKNTVSDIQDKLKDIQKLEASVNQCVQLFN
jgi:t-SNARE complex subunit (syntaxin)